MNKFEICSLWEDKDINLPVRKTAHSAGYDFEAADDIIIPSYQSCCAGIQKTFGADVSMASLKDMKAVSKASGCQPSLIPTGVKCKLDPDCYLELSVRSSSPLKYWLVLANGVGIIDADYYNNKDNEGHIFFQVINLSPVDLIIKKGETIGQGVIHKYETVVDDCPKEAVRSGGFGSTDKEG